MIIISHRGYWSAEKYKNSKVSFKKSFQFGFGVETDIRDHKGELVVSHDMPDDDSMLLCSFFSLYSKYGNNLPLALNIKSDGLQGKLKNLLKEYNITNYFVFDTSIPDGLSYLNEKMVYFARQSEYEVIPSLYDKSDGIWLDGFKENWITVDTIRGHLLNKKNICIVSPELHGRPFDGEWGRYKEMGVVLGADAEKIMICTDFPEHARRFFHEG